MECTDMMKIPKLFAVRLPVGFFDLWKTALHFYFCGVPQFHIQHICKAVIVSISLEVYDNIFCMQCFPMYCCNFELTVN